jgi:hypothetical protein
LAKSLKIKHIITSVQSFGDDVVDVHLAFTLSASLAAMSIPLQHSLTQQAPAFR